MTPAVAVCEGRIAVRPLRRPGTEAPLFLIAAPDVNSLGYVALSRALPPGESPCSVEPLRRGAALRRDYEPEEIAELSTEYLAAVRAYQPKGPYHLAGMCAGAHLVFEMARRLEAEGERVSLAAMLDTWPVENSSHYPLVVLWQIRYRWRSLPPGERLSWIGKSLHRALAALAARLARTPRPPAEESPRDRWRARVWPGEGFTPPMYGGRITVVRARRQPFFRKRDRTLGWQARSRGEARVFTVPGDHLTLLREPTVGAVAGALAAALRAARDGE